jgi:hypothetical protein
MPSVRRLSLVLAVATAAALTLTSSAHARRTIKLKYPSFVVPPRSDRETCTFVRLPMKKPFDLGGSIVTNIGLNPTFTSHHFLLWAYEGTDIEKFPPKGQLVDSKACLDFGPTDANQRTLITGSQSPKLTTRLADGLAQQIKPTVSGGQSVVGLILNAHWINGSDKPQRGSVKIKLTAAKKHSVRQYLLPLFDVVANGFLKAPPGEVKSVSWAWGPGLPDYGGSLGGGAFPTGPACVVSLTSHMHKRGKLFTIDFLDGSASPPRVLSNEDYADPPQVQFTPALLVNPGQRLRYTCTHDNGVTTAVKMGCEEQAGVTPGVDAATALFSGRGTTGAAKRCATDADCAGFGTGKCVPANLVFGFTSDDDMCIMPGGWYPATNGSCDLSGLPTQN